MMHSRWQDQHENRPEKVTLCSGGNPKHLELMGRSCQECHGGPSYHIKELEFHFLYHEKSTNYFQHVGNVVRCSFKIDHFGTEVGFYEMNLEAVNLGRKWPK